MENKNIMDYETVELDDQENALVIIDQTKLPGKTEIIRLKTAQEMWDAIYPVSYTHLGRASRRGL